MARKTVAQNYSSEDRIRLINRRILSHSDDAKAICYEYEENEEVAALVSLPAHAATRSTAKTSVTLIPNSSVALLPGANITTQATNVSPNAVEDVPLSAVDVVLALTGDKLKRPLDDVSIHKSLRDLSGGENMPFYC